MRIMTSVAQLLLTFLVISLSLCSKGTLGQPCPTTCPTVYDPVCSSNFETFGNECFLTLDNCNRGDAAYVLYRGPCVSTTTSSPSVTTACSIFCPAIFDPVCGTDGTTYANECVLGIAKNCGNRPYLGVAYKGQCTNCSQIICTDVYAPVCGSDGQTYGNDCELGRARVCSKPNLSKFYNGPCTCRPDTFCTREYFPVCGTDGVTYSNNCTLIMASICNPSIRLRHIGPCDSCGRNCPEIYAPVCGADGVTYDNDCFLASVKACSKPSLSKLYDGRCTCRPDTSCTKEYFPVCGTDGVTYSNNCTLIVASMCNPSIRLRHLGPCIQCDPRACPAIYDPVCGSDGVTYANDCILDGVKSCRNPSLEKVVDGQCGCNMPCYHHIAHVCGTDGKTYDNLCLLIRANYCSPDVHITMRARGSCVSGCDSSCPSVYSPVCGSDRRLYDNECQLKCSNPSISVLRRCSNDWVQGPCSDKFCDNVYQPVCGSDGWTYRNRCFLERISYCSDQGRIRLYVKHPGSCDGGVSKAAGTSGSATSVLAASLFLMMFQM